MKKLLISFILVLGIFTASSVNAINLTSQELGELLQGGQSSMLGATYLFPSGGGTGTSTNPTYGKMLVGNAGGTYDVIATSTLGLGSGTVTSVAMTVPTGLTVSGSPITTSGTLAVTFTAGYSIPTTVLQNTWSNKWDYESSTIPVAKTLLTGGAGLTLTVDDMACDTASGSVFGCLSAANWNTFNNKWDLASSTIGAIYGGTSQSTYTAGDILYASAANTLSKLAATTNGYVLSLSAGLPAWVATSSSGTVNSGTIGQMAFYAATGTAVSGTSTLIALDKKIGVATSTPQHALSVFSAASPQLALTAGNNLAQWTFRNAGGNLYVATTTTDGTATTTPSALTILNNGRIGIRQPVPTIPFEIQVSDQTAAENGYDSDTILGVEKNGDAYIQIQGNDAGTAGLILRDNIGIAAGIFYDTTVGLNLRTNSITQFSLNNLGQFGFSTTSQSYLYDFHGQNAQGTGRRDFRVGGGGTADVNLFFISTTNNKIGVASSSPWGLLSVEQGTEAHSFVVSNTGSSTPSLVVRGVNGNGNVGIASTTPSYRLSVNSGSSAFAVNDSGIIIQGTWNGTVIDEAYIDWVVTGQVVDFGGATSLEAPNASNPTVNASGEYAVNTDTGTSTAWVYYDATNEIPVYSRVPLFGVTIASSTLAAYNGLLATSTIDIGSSWYGENITKVRCYASSTGSVMLRLEGSDFSCSQNTDDKSANINIRSGRLRSAQIGSSSGAWTNLVIQGLGRIFTDAD